MALSLRVHSPESWSSIRVFSTAIISTLALAAFPLSSAIAQDDAMAESDADQPIEEIITTGSRIRRDEFTSSSPVQIIDMEMQTLAGLVDVADILQGSTVAANSSQINNLLGGFVLDGGPGVNTLDLRGVGAGKTLVLLNGRRLNPAGTRGTVASVDLNTLPASVIKRVEILKDGASSVYGSDAVAGVANIVTRDNLDGFSGHVQSSVPWDSGGEVTSADVVWGISTDRANIMVGVEWFERQALKEIDRDWALCQEENYFDPDTGENISTIDPTTGEIKCWGGPANDYVIVRSGTFTGRHTRDASVDCVGATGPCVEGWDIGTPFQVRQFDHPRQRQADIISPARRINFFSFGNIELDSPLSDSPMTAYYEYMYNSRRSTQHGGPRQFAPAVDQLSLAAEVFSPFYDGTGTNREQPLLLPYDQVGTQEVNWTRALVGITGEFGASEWAYDLHYSYGRSHGTYGSQQLLVDRIAQSLDIVEVAPNEYDCRSNVGGNSFFDQNTPCVVFDPYIEIGRLNNFDPDVLNYITSYEVGTTNYQQQLIDGYVTGNLFDMPAGSVAAVFGFQLRDEEIEDTPSSGSIARNLWGFTSSGITAGNEKVFELYTEIELPLLQDVPAAQDLTLSLSGRYTDYKTVGDDTTYKAGINWQIIDQLRLRSSYGTSFRAPALYESFLGGQTAFSSANDACEEWDTDNDPTSNTYQNCATEVPLGHQGFTSTPQVITFGNAGRLLPETSDSLTIGTVIDFDSIGLSFAVDYFDLEIVDEIAKFGPGSIMNQCYSLPTDQFRQPGTVCDFLSERDPVSLNIDEINDSYFNINKKNVDGYDLTVRYNFAFSAVDFVADLRASKINTWTRTLFGDVVDDLNGTIGLPEDNAQFDLTANWRDWTFYYGFDWVGDQEEYTYNGIDPAESIFILDTGSVSYHSLSARFTSENWSAQVGVTNLTDEDPPIVSDVLQALAGGAAFYTGYDLRGRSVYLDFSMEF